MKLKSLMLMALCFVLFACGENLDVAPTEVDSPASFGPVEGDPVPSGPDYNISTNFVMVSGSNDQALLNYGISPQLSEQVRIKPKFSIKVDGDNQWYELFFNPYGELIINPGNQLSNVMTITREDLLICEPSFQLKMEVDYVKIGGVVIDESEYDVLSFLPDGSTILNMNGPGCPTSPGPGYVSWKSYIGTKPVVTNPGSFVVR